MRSALVWFARVVTKDPLLSVALFELLHDVQYLAIVWAVNRRLVDRAVEARVPGREEHAARARGDLRRMGDGDDLGATAEPG